MELLVYIVLFLNKTFIVQQHDLLKKNYLKVRKINIDVLLNECNTKMCM
jgi:hypothetical protein